MESLNKKSLAYVKAPTGAKKYLEFFASLDTHEFESELTDKDFLYLSDNTVDPTEKKHFLEEKRKSCWEKKWESKMTVGDYIYLAGTTTDSQEKEFFLEKAKSVRERKSWKRMEVNGIAGWFVPDHATTPPQALCKGCQFIVAQQKHYAELCREVNKRFGGIRGWTKGVDGTLPPDEICPLNLTL